VNNDWRRKTWWVGLLAFAVMLGLAYGNASGTVPSWLYWLAFSMYVAGMGTFYVYRWHWQPARAKVDAALADTRPESWRVTDSRTTDGDERGA
jgi:hypothetical protein